MTEFDVEVYYDGQCPLCLREMRMLRRLDKRGRIRFIDITAPDFDPAAVSITREALMGRIHARLPDGTVVEGVEVFRRLYAAVGFTRLVAVTRWPGLAQMLDVGYRWFAKNRLRLTGRCAGQVCSVGSGSESQMPADMINQTTVLTFGAGRLSWDGISDPIMGGLSRGRMVTTGKVGVFTGVVSLDHGGGFASVRSREGCYDLATFDGLVVRARGDGKRYGLRLRIADAFEGVNYQVDFQPDRAWQELRFPFHDFRPVLRGRPVVGHPPLDPAHIKTFGLIIAHRQTGPFRLELESIDAYRESAGSESISHPGSSSDPDPRADSGDPPRARPPTREW